MHAFQSLFEVPIDGNSFDNDWGFLFNDILRMGMVNVFMFLIEAVAYDDLSVLFSMRLIRVMLSITVGLMAYWLFAHRVVSAPTTRHIHETTGDSK